MQRSPQTPDHSECHICRTRLQPGSTFCPYCGARVDEMPEEEMRGVTYLLSELARWEAQGIIGSEQAAGLRQRYEHRRDELRAHLESDGKKAYSPAPASRDALAPAPVAQQPAESTPRIQARDTTPHASAPATDSPDYSVAAAFSHFLSTSPSPPPPPPASALLEPRPRRTLIETLSDPYIIRLLSFTGASMLVVGVVIWLKDILYLKLREPVVQASLLALGTIIVT